MQDIKQRLKERRERLGLSQIALAIRSGVSERAIAGYETGADPSYSRLVKLAEALGVSPAWLIGGEDAPAAMRESFGAENPESLRRRADVAEQRLAALCKELRIVLANYEPSSLHPMAEKIASELVDQVKSEAKYKKRPSV